MNKTGIHPVRRAAPKSYCSTTPSRTPCEDEYPKALGPDLERSSVELSRKRHLRIVREPLKEGYFYPCTRPDALQAIEALPECYDTVWRHSQNRVLTLIFYQPKKKESLLLWASCAFRSRLVSRTSRGCTIVIPAQDLERVCSEEGELEQCNTKFGVDCEHGGKKAFKPCMLPFEINSSGLAPSDKEEVDRLLNLDRLEHTVAKSMLQFAPSFESVRRLVLYRSLFHEFGHLYDMATREARGDGASYWTRSHVEREDYAHAEAETIAEQLRKSGSIPFAIVEEMNWPTILAQFGRKGNAKEQNDGDGESVLLDDNEANHSGERSNDDVNEATPFEGESVELVEKRVTNDDGLS